MVHLESMATSDFQFTVLPQVIFIEHTSCFFVIKIEIGRMRPDPLNPGPSVSEAMYSRGLQNSRTRTAGAKYIENNTWARGDMTFIFECSSTISHE
jgi:hypothetical protein